MLPRKYRKSGLNELVQNIFTVTKAVQSPTNAVGLLQLLGFGGATRAARSRDRVSRHYGGVSGCF